MVIGIAWRVVLQVFVGLGNPPPVTLEPVQTLPTLIGNDISEDPLVAPLVEVYPYPCIDPVFWIQNYADKDKISILIDGFFER